MPSLDAMEGTWGKEVRADRIQLNLLGGSEASRGGRPIAFRTRKSLALLVYLAVDPGPHPRERLADLLWPESGVADARASLRTALNYMRHGLGPSADSVVLATRESLGVRRGAPVDVDVQALARAQRLARLEGNTLGDEIVTAVAQYRGPFLAGMLLSDAPDFEAWVETQRTYWPRGAPGAPTARPWRSSMRSRVAKWLRRMTKSSVDATQTFFLDLLQRLRSALARPPGRPASSRSF